MRQRLVVLLLNLAALLVGPPTAARADSATQLPFTGGELDQSASAG